MPGKSRRQGERSWPFVGHRAASGSGEQSADVFSAAGPWRRARRVRRCPVQHPPSGRPTSGRARAEARGRDHSN